jgi:hypothetical protein
MDTLGRKALGGGELSPSLLPIGERATPFFERLWEKVPSRSEGG